MSESGHCAANVQRNESAMEEFRKLIALAWEGDSDVEDLDDLVVRCKEHNIEALHFMETNSEDLECFTDSREVFEQSLSKMKRMADGRSNIQKGDLAFVSSRIAVNALAKLCGSGDYNLLTIEHRQWIEPYLEALNRLNLNGHVDCSVLEQNIFKLSKIPLELIWWLQSKGFVQLSSYVSSTIADTDKTKQLNADLWSLVTDCRDDVDDADMFSDERITRRMTKDLLTNLISAAHLGTAASAEACSVLIDSIVKKLVKRASTEEAPTVNLLGLLRGGSGGGAGLAAMATQMLERYMVLTPYVPLPRALSSQADWVYRKIGRNVGAFIKGALECLGIEESMALIQKMIREGEVNWRHLMAIVTTLVVELPGASKHIADLLESLVRESLFAENRDLLTAAVLLARQCCLESGGGGAFPPYDAWFASTFGRAGTAAAFAFLLRFLGELVPCEPVYVLQAHLKKGLLAAAGCDSLWQDYTTLARCRLAELAVDATRSLLGATSAVEDVEIVRRHWETRREVLPALLAASRLQRMHYEKEWLPVLLSSPHSEIIDKLKSMGRIPNHVLAKHAETVAAKALLPPSPAVRLAGSLCRLQEALGLRPAEGDVVDAAADLVERLTLANLTERTPLENHRQMVDALSFCLDYQTVVTLRPDLAKPVGLAKLVRYLSERLSHCPRSHRHTLPDCSRLPRAEAMDLKEFLAQESKVTAEWLPSASAYMERTLAGWHVPALGAAKTATALLVAAFRPWAGEAGREAALAALATLAAVRGGGGGQGAAWLLKCWVQMVPAVCTHAQFFRVVARLPRSLLLTDCCQAMPTPDAVLRLAAFINADLVVGLADGCFLCPNFVWHLTVTMSQFSDAKLFSLLLDKCPAFHVGLLMNGWCNLSHLSLAFPSDLHRDNGALSLVTLLKLHRHFNQSQDASVVSCLNLAAPWQVALVVFASTVQTERKAAFTINQRELLSSEKLTRWLFYFHLVNLLEKIDLNEAKFTISAEKVGFVYENILEPSPLLALDMMFDANPKVVTVLTEDCSSIPLSGFSARTLKLASVTGLLYLLHRKFFESRSHGVISEVLRSLKGSLVQAHSLLPKFLGVEWKESVANINKLCVDVLSTVTIPVAESDPDIYILDDDDDFMIPDDLP